jgi:hypothetical protein
MSEKVTYTLCFDADQLADIIEGLQQLGRLPLAYTHAEFEAAVSQTIDECGEAINEWRATPCSLGTHVSTFLLWANASCLISV